MESPTLEESLDTLETVDDADAPPPDPELVSNGKSEEAVVDEEEDWDVEMDLGPTGGAKAIPSPPINASSVAWHASMSAATNGFMGTVTRLGAASKSDVEESWDEFDIDLNSSEETPTLGSTLVPHTKIAADLSDWDDDDDDEAISTIKVLSGQFTLPGAPTSSTPPHKVQPIPDDEDFEEDFSLPDDLAHLSLRPLKHRSSKNNLDGWGDQTSSSTAYSSEASSFGAGTNESPSSNSVSLYSQGAETDEDDGTLLDGLILPEDLFGSEDNDGKLLHKLIEKRKQQAATEVIAVASPHEEDDFESGLVIDDDVDFNLSKVKHHRHSSSASRSLKAFSMQAPPRPQLFEENSSPSRSQSLTNSPETPRDPVVHEYKSPLSRSFASVARAASPRPSGANSPVSFRPPLRETRASFHGASRPIISPPSSFSTSTRDPLRRQSSAGTLQTSLSIIDVHTVPSPTGDAVRVTLKRPSPNGEAVSPQFTRRIPPAPVSSPIGRYNNSVSARSRSMNSPLSPATMMSLSSSASRLQQSPHFVPPTPPGTPSSNPIALRLTMSTSSSRAKSRPALISIFPGASMNSGSQGLPRPSSFAAAVKSPVRSPLSTPSTPQTPQATSSPIRHRGTPMSRSSTVSAVAASVPQPLQAKILKRPKRLRIYGDGTELDGIEDLPTDKDWAIRRNSGATKPEDGGLNDSTGSRLSRRRADLTSNRASVSSSATATPSRGQLPLSPMNSPKHEKRRSIASLPLKRRPMLIRNLNGVGAPKVVGQMRWNPQSLRWEGNDQELRAFENAVGSSTRPALITKLSGAALGSPIQSGSGKDGARVVGNMLFDPVEMRWVSQLPPEEEEPDVFADLADDEEEDLSFWGNNKGGTIRASSALLASIRIAPASPDRSTSDGANTSQNNILLLASPLSDGNPSPARSSHSRGESEMETSLDGASDGGDGITDVFIDETMQAEARHRTEMLGWLISPIREDASNTNLSPDAVPFPAGDAIETEAYDRAFLYDLRAIALRSKASTA